MQKKRESLAIALNILDEKELEMITDLYTSGMEDLNELNVILNDHRQGARKVELLKTLADKQAAVKEFVVVGGKKKEERMSGNGEDQDESEVSPSSVTQMRGSANRGNFSNTPASSSKPASNPSSASSATPKEKGKKSAHQESANDWICPNKECVLNKSNPSEKVFGDRHPYKCGKCGTERPGCDFI